MPGEAEGLKQQAESSMPEEKSVSAQWSIEIELFDHSTNQQLNQTSRRIKSWE